MKENLIVVDLDGTLLNDNNEISSYDKIILKKCKEIGCKIAINTTRNYLRTIKYKEEINADYTICFNGNYVINSKEIFSNAMSIGTVKKILNILNSNKLNFIIECLNGTYRNRIKEYSILESNYVRLEDISLNNCYKFLVECDSFKAIEMINKFAHLNLSLSYDEKNNFLRIMPKNSDKWNGLNKLNLDKYNVISFGNDANDYELLKNSLIGVKMKNANNLDNIQFETDSNNESGVGKFLKNYFNFSIDTYFKNVKVLDCSLRDGGHLNNSIFGIKTINSIIDKLLKAKVDIIEIGFLEDCKYRKDRACFSTIEEANNLVENKNNPYSIFSVLTQVDKFDIDKLNECSGKVKMIRVSFHNNLIDMGMEYCKKVIEKGYICSCNPINFSNYSNEEIIHLIKKVNEIKPDYFSVVDTFGILLNNDFSNKINLLNNLLSKDIKLGLHLHDNLLSSFSTAQILVQEQSRFNDIIIDSAIGGLGRAPGNLKTEILLYYLNLNNKNKYDIKYIYDALDKEIAEIKSQYNCNFNFIYSLTAFKKLHRTYGEYLIKKNCSILDASFILDDIPERNKKRYNEKVIKKIYEEYWR